MSHRGVWKGDLSGLCCRLFFISLACPSLTTESGGILKAMNLSIISTASSAQAVQKNSEDRIEWSSVVGVTI
jgi:hypothetical protein